MEKSDRIRELVKVLSENAKCEILKAMEETALHREIKELLCAMEPDALVEITHGSDEYGKDLVMIRKSAFGEQVTALVVVRGDIRTRSSGTIDKVKSQVEQCFAHPARLASVSRDLRVSFTWLVVAGTMSEQANIRLRAEIKYPNFEVFDLKWLVEAFTAHYPYVFFDSMVSRYLESTIGKLENAHLLHGRSQLLSDYYVNHRIATLERVIELSDNGTTFTLLKDVKSFEEMKRDIVPPRRFLIVGDPGVGKTTVLAKLAIDILSRSLEMATRGKVEDLLEIPILVKAKEIAQCGSLDDLVMIHGPSEEVRHRFKVRALMVDGLDEVPGQLRQSVIEKSINYSDTLGSSLLITTRRIDIVRKEIAKLERHELLPMEFAQAMNLYRRLTGDERVLSALKDGLEKVRGQLPMTPLSLLLLIDLVEANKEIPASAVELYDRFTDLALGSEDKLTKGISVLFDYKIKKRFLEELAFAGFYGKGRDTMSREDLDSFVGDYSKKYGWNVEQLTSFVEEIERAGLLQIGEEVKFAHASFLDYFVALRIFNTREEIDGLVDYLSETYFDEWWADIVFYYIGMKTEVSKELLDKIMEHDGNTIVDIVSKAMIGRLLQAGWHSLPETMVQGIAQAQSMCPDIKQLFMERAKQRDIKAPLILADIYAMLICEQSFGSRFLWQHSRTLIDRYLEQPTQDSVMKSIQLLWPMTGRISTEEASDLLKRMFAAATLAPRQDEEANTNYTRNLLFLNALTKQEPDLQKSIGKKVSRQRELYPDFFTKLLPYRPSGFRSEEARKEARKRKATGRKRRKS